METKESSLLFSAEELASRLSAREPPVVVEVIGGDQLSCAGSELRIPGSHRCWRPQYQRPCSAAQPLDGLVPTAMEFQAFARKLGVNEESEICVVDRKYDATRLWWLFNFFGHTRVRLLDGGFDTWLRLGLPVTREAPASPTFGNWNAKAPRLEMLAVREQVKSLQAGGRDRLWDVRTVEEWSGERIMEGAACGGRIPWSQGRIDWSLFRSIRDGKPGEWMSKHTIRRLAFEVLKGTEPGDGVCHTFYCQSGVRTTQLIFGMALAGWPIECLRNYDGSWIEWSCSAAVGEIVRGL